MRGITGFGTYLPYRRLDLASVASFAGGGGRRGQRTVASFDEDATTMAFEAARTAIRSLPGTDVASLWYSTAAPPYLDRTNANAVHAALRLRRDAPAYDLVGSSRGAFGALRAALGTAGPAVAVASDVRTGRPGGPDEAYFGDGAAAMVVGEGAGEAPLLAEILGWGTTTDEFVDRWRTPGDANSKSWEERFGEVRYVDSAIEALEAAIRQSGITADHVDRLLVTGTHGRAVRAMGGRSGIKVDPLVDQLASSVGVTGCAHPFILLAAALETAIPGEVIVLIALADGAEVLVVRATEAVRGFRPLRALLAQMSGGAPIAYGRYLAWRGVLPVEPPRRPEPARVSSPAAARSTAWKFALVGSRSEAGQVSMPPNFGDPDRVDMADARGTIRTFTIDRLSYTPSPPLVFAIVDFDGGGRLPVELTDVDAAEVRVGGRVEMVFRRLSTADGIHNYFWKGRPVREGST